MIRLCLYWGLDASNEGITFVFYDSSTNIINVCGLMNISNHMPLIFNFKLFALNGIDKENSSPSDEDDYEEMDGEDDSIIV